MQWRDDSPDWKDEGRKVKVLAKSGCTQDGELCFDDFVNDGEDEYPLWNVRFENGELSSLWEFEGWMFV